MVKTEWHCTYILPIRLNAVRRNVFAYAFTIYFDTHSCVKMNVLNMLMWEHATILYTALFRTSSSVTTRVYIRPFLGSPAQ
jgi:hypothetical protein